MTDEGNRLQRSPLGKIRTTDTFPMSAAFGPSRRSIVPPKDRAHFRPRSQKPPEFQDTPRAPPRNSKEINGFDFLAVSLPLPPPPSS
jgi:hypothetical protein